ncbi:MAG: ABC transporter substrate-binding protein [Candidatus Atabeyarchaeum deiterrae]
MQQKRVLYTLFVAITILVGIASPFGNSAFITPASAQDETGNIVIHVVDSVNNPISAASVVSIAEPTGQSPLSRLTDQNGIAEFLGVTPGDYRFEIFKDGYYYSYEPLRVEALQTTYKTVGLDMFTGYGPHASEIVFNEYPDSYAQYQAMKDGLVDTMTWQIPSDLIPDAIQRQTDGQFKLSMQPSPTIVQIAINCLPARYPLNQVGFRKALAHLVDKDSIVATGLGGYGYVLNNLVPSAYLGVWSNPSVRTYAYSLSEANRTLYDYGFYYTAQANSFPLTGGVWKDKNGVDIRSIELLSRIDILARKFAAEQLGQALDELDISHTLRLLTRDDFRHVAYEAPWDDTDLVFGGWGTSPDPTYLWSFFNSRSDPYYNYVFWNNSTYDYWSDLMMKSSNYTEVLTACYKCQELLADGVPYIPLYNQLSVGAGSVDWDGWIDAINPCSDVGIANFYSFIEVHPIGATVGGSLRIGLHAPLTSLNYFGLHTYSTDFYVFDLIYEPLTRPDPYTSVWQPWMAESYKIETFDLNPSEQGLKITFVLRDNLKWHDGEKVNSTDVKTTFELFNSTGWINTLHNVTTPDDRTAIVYLKTASFFAFSSIAWLPILPNHIWSDYAADPNIWNLDVEQLGMLVGSGPYVFEEHSTGNYVRLKAFADYVRPPVSWSEPMYTPIGSGIEVSDPVTNIAVTFDQVTESGTTLVTTSEMGPGPPLEFQVTSTYYHIMTDASYTDAITIAIPYNESRIQGDEESLRLMHWDQSMATWVDVTSGRDTTNNIIYGTVTSLSIFALMADVVPPTTELTIGTHYSDPSGRTYVTSSTDLTLVAGDQGSGVRNTYYRINSGDWIPYAGAFHLVGSDGTYTISYYSTDVAGNNETAKSTTLTLTSINVDSYISKGDSNRISYFDVVFSKDKSSGYRLVSTNPGEFFYNFEVTNNWPIPARTMAINLAIPSAFAMKGANPIQVYLNGNDITGYCTITGTTITIANVPAGGTVHVRVHLDYALKGTIYPSLDSFAMRGYAFHTSVTGSGDLIGTHASTTDLIAHQKKTTAIAGFVTDANGNGVQGLTVQLFDSIGNLIQTTVTDENGFYYFIDIQAGSYTVKVTDSGATYIQSVIAIDRELMGLDFGIQ